VPFFRMLGFEQVESCDIVDWEGADHLFDLNDEVPVELVGRFEGERRALPALALTTDTSILTAVANDYSYHLVFARQVAAFATPGDLLVAISTSGRSANVLAAAAEARRIGCPVIALTGEGGGDLAGAAEVVLAVPSRRTSRIQEIHALCLHALLERVEARLAADAEPER